MTCADRPRLPARIAGTLHLINTACALFAFITASARMACGVALLGVLLTGSGCTTRIAPPGVGSTLDPAVRASSIAVSGGDDVWRLMKTTLPSVSWGGEGTYGYHLVRENPNTGRVVAVVDLGERTNQRVGNLGIGYGSVWLGLTKGSLIKVDASTNAVAGVIHVANVGWWRGDENIPKVAVGEGAVWVLVWGRDELFRVDPESGQVEMIRLGTGLGPPSSVEVFSGTVVVKHKDGISRVDPRTKVTKAPGE